MNYTTWSGKRDTMSVATTVANGLVYFNGKWLLYHGAADRVSDLATCAR